MTIDTFTILKSALESRGFSFDQIQIGNGEKCMRATSAKGGKLLMPLASFTYPFATSLAKQLSVDKVSAYAYAESLGVTIPKTCYSSDFEEDADDLREFLDTNGTVVVKPSSGSLSNGVTRDVADMNRLAEAWKIARSISPTVVVQKQFLGEEYRFVVASGEIVAVLMRKKASVIGDGKHTIKELIGIENLERGRIVDTKQTYPLLDDELVEASLLESQRVAEEGEYIELAKGTRVMLGASMYEVKNSVHESYIEIAHQLTKGIGNGFMVADLMIEDCKAEANEDNYVFLEYNSSPALAPFYSCRDGNHFPIAERILAPMLERVADTHYL